MVATEVVEYSMMKEYGVDRHPAAIVFSELANVLLILYFVKVLAGGVLKQVPFPSFRVHTTLFVDKHRMGAPSMDGVPWCLSIIISPFLGVEVYLL